LSKELATPMVKLNYYKKEKSYRKVSQPSSCGKKYNHLLVKWNYALMDFLNFGKQLQMWVRPKTVNDLKL
jgi:hypothetical protein